MRVLFLEIDTESDWAVASVGAVGQPPAIDPDPARDHPGRHRRILRSRTGIRVEYTLRRYDSAGSNSDRVAVMDAFEATATAAQPIGPYSTVTLFARLRGWSTSVPFRTAV